MKLNERSVAYYATCSSPPDKTGFLLKKGDRNPAYHRRWCVLKGNLLFYFEERESREPLGVIVLEGCTVELCDSESAEFAFAVRFECTRARVYKLAADGAVAMESWVKALSRASFDYMRLVVRELEYQLEEARQGATSPWAKGRGKRPLVHGGGERCGAGGGGGRGGAHPRPTLCVSRASAPVGLQGSLSQDPEVSEEGVLSLGNLGKENGVSWNKPLGLANGVGEVGVSGMVWEGELDDGDGEIPPPIPPRRKTPGGSLESPVSPGTGCFSKLHDWYGKEVAELRVEWLQSQ
ncbi:sesquipedalian-1 [Electrophorus electricus]|uniref:sesquipedalian-1 n=1 Tax=Electrophorus electricus TaxID=8005 RepID=UPI000F0A6813|nr:sesquipedalian-1 [Electrophorus electricus]XP_026880946.1 sesquipedalian-1 [Electrophorus electricus]XP_035382136.1 sesquipedalian-1 [Electrophorus electricus]